MEILIYKLFIIFLNYFINVIITFISEGTINTSDKVVITIMAIDTIKTYKYLFITTLKSTVFLLIMESIILRDKEIAYDIKTIKTYILIM